MGPSSLHSVARFRGRTDAQPIEKNIYNMQTNIKLPTSKTSE